MNLKFKNIAMMALVAMFAVASAANAQKPDPNFFIYLCFGQSNMEAGAAPAEQDKNFTDERFQFMAAVDMPRYGRKMGNWYQATPPICREGNNMGPVDFFGRKMIEVLPQQYKVGVINVSVAGAKLELWDKDACAEYLAKENADPSRQWLGNMAKQYGDNPYQRLLDMAKIAQKSGVIKGMLVHQGESNPDDPEWCGRLKKIHDDLCRELGLKADEIPLLAGELKQAEQGGVCAAFNQKVLANLPKVMKNGYVISSIGCESTGDQFHFSTEGMRLMGYRMADKMLQLQGFKKTETRTLTLNPKKTGIDISPTLAGIFFEDINQSLDGGICAQLIQNNSFQAYKVPEAPAKEFSQSDTVFFGWTVVKNTNAVGTARLVSDHPLVKNQPRYYDFDPNDNHDDELRYVQYSVRFDIEKAGEGFGIAANGYGIAPYGSERQGNYYSNNTQKASIPVNANVKYDLGLYLQGQGYKGTVKVFLEDAQGKANSNVITINNLKDDWQKYTGQLQAERSVDSRLAIVADAEGTFFLDFVTLLPEASQLWKDGKAGPFRKDLMQALADLHPKFMRFPGGCASEGTNYFGQPFWKNSVGPEEERIGFRNHWGYWTSQYVGFYEYLLMAESLGASPLPVLNNGVTCQFAGHQYIAPLETEADKKRFNDIFVNDALDFIEFCNGSTDSKWGSLRAKMGHPESFNLKYLGIGNENRGAEFWERFDIMYKAIKAKYPDIIIVSTAGSAADGREFNENMSQIDSKYQDTYVDEHYYRGNDWFYKNGDRYNADKVRGADGIKYDRSRPTRVFVGEFANNGSNNDYASAMAEAAYWTSLERNSDMVVMAAYAPLLCKKGFNKWNSNLIWFDNRGMWRTCNYYYQSIFSVAGNKAFEMTDVMDGKAKDEKVFTSPTINTETGEIFIKFVNSEAADKALTINTGSGQKYTASVEFITSNNTAIKNQGTQNHYAGYVDPNAATAGNSPYDYSRGVGMPRGFTFGGGSRFSYTEAVVPHTVDLGQVKKSFEMTMPENSVGLIRLVPVK
ncbi:MAG: alpha-L-arabinofuranosidase [Bacteroidaceae bacterium]|nr:alpha-L-arabinofuranosidase [Bacteroidaceae bacterium]